jgi:hypothetical protein
MADIISDEIVDRVCEEVGTYSDEQARAEMTRLSKQQPGLLAYVMGVSEDLPPDAQELAVYMFVVIHRTFEQQFGNRLQNAGIDRIEHIAEMNEEAMLKLAERDDEELPETAMAYAQHQPALLGYVSECLFEPEEGFPQLSEEDQGVLTLIMKTVIDVLDSSVRAE